MAVAINSQGAIAILTLFTDFHLVTEQCQIAFLSRMELLFIFVSKIWNSLSQILFDSFVDFI
jgi:hypothetical protein